MVDTLVKYDPRGYTMRMRVRDIGGGHEFEDITIRNQANRKSVMYMLSDQDMRDMRDWLTARLEEKGRA